MAYADATYYNEVYKGIKVEPIEELERLLERASDQVDFLTHYRIKDFEIMLDFNKSLIKKATCAQVESFQKNGGIDNVGSSVNSLNVGSFSYSNSDSKNSFNAIDPLVFNYLSATGLLYSGVDTVAF